MSIELRPYQIKPVEALANTRLGYIEARAGSGKTIMVAMACKFHEVKALKPLHVVWLAGTKEIVEQGKQACDAVGLLGTQEFHCFQGLKEVPECDILVVDECHQVAAPSYKDLLRTTLYKEDGRWKRRCITLGMTATKDRDDGEPIEPIIGPCVYRVDPDEIKKAGGVLPCEVRVVEYGQDRTKEIEQEASKLYDGRLQWADRNKGTDENWKRCLYRSACQIGILNDPQRDKLIAELVTKHDGETVLVLVGQVEHGKRIASMIPNAVVFHSGMKQRAEKIKLLKAGVIKVAIATQLADQGLDVPIASVLIMAHGGRSWRATIQRTGRILRPHAGKTKGIVYDFKDVSHPMLTAQFWTRVRHYKKIGYGIDTLWS